MALEETLNSFDNRREVHDLITGFGLFLPSGLILPAGLQKFLALAIVIR